MNAPINHHRAMSEELKASYERISHMEATLWVARSQLATLGGDYTTTEDQIHLAVLEEIDEVLA